MAHSSIYSRIDSLSSAIEHLRLHLIERHGLLAPIHIESPIFLSDGRPLSEHARHTQYTAHKNGRYKLPAAQS